MYIQCEISDITEKSECGIINIITKQKQFGSYVQLSRDMSKVFHMYLACEQFITHCSPKFSKDKNERIAIQLLELFNIWYIRVLRKHLFELSADNFFR